MEKDPEKVATSFAKEQQSVKRRKINPTTNSMGSNDAVVDPPRLVPRDSLETVTTPKTNDNNDTSQCAKMATAASFDDDKYINSSSSSIDEGENSRLDMESGDSSDQHGDEDYFLDSLEEKPGDLDLGRSFFLRQPIAESEVPSVEIKVRDNLVKSVDLLEEQGYEAYRQWKTKVTAKDEAKAKVEQKTMEEALEDAKIKGQPRHYQQQLFEIACKQNTIVNLGTGAGKTLIGLMMIRHFAPSFQQGKQVLFMVPSVALAIQQSTTLRANLPYSIKVACYSTCTSIKARKELQECEIVVATHGAVSIGLKEYDLCSNPSHPFLRFYCTQHSSLMICLCIMGICSL
jgi:hypothetical protein